MENTNSTEFNYDEYLSEFTKVKFTDEDYHIWDLWASSDIIYMQEILYKDLLEDDIYIRCIRYEYDYNEEDNTQVCTVFKDAILSCNALRSEDFGESESIETTEKLIKKIDEGHIVRPRDIVGNLVGAGSYYDFYEEGTEITTLVISEDKELSAEIEKIGESILK